MTHVIIHCLPLICPAGPNGNLNSERDLKREDRGGVWRYYIESSSLWGVLSVTSARQGG